MQDNQEFVPTQLKDPSIFSKPLGKYLSERRTEHRKSAIGIGMIAIASLAGYLMFSSMALPPKILPMLSMSIVATAMTLALYIFLLNKQYYLSFEFFDSIPFLLISVAQISINLAFFPVMQEFGSSEVNTISFNSAVLIAAGSILIVGSFRSFLIIAFLCSAITVTVAIAVTSNPWHLTQLAPFGTMLALAIFLNYTLERISRTSQFRRDLVDEQNNYIQQLLYNVLPENVVKRMKGGEIIADSYSEASVIFCDIVGFSELSKRLPPRMLVGILEDLFDNADECANSLNVEKVKTIGDAYMAVAGGAIAVEDSAATAIEFGIQIRERFLAARAKHGLDDLDLRVGIHTGPVIGAVIGQVKKSYDYWGDTVNIASRVQGCAEPGEVVTTEQSRLSAHANYTFGQPQLHELKGVGEVKVFNVLGRKSKPSQSKD